MRAGLLRRRDDPRPAHRLDGQGRAHDAGGRRARGPALQPRQGVLPQARVDEARPGRVLPGRLRRRPRPRARAPHRDEALRERHHGGPDLAEAGAAEGAGLAPDRDRRVPVGPHGRGARRQRRRPSRLGRQPGRDRLQPLAGAALGPRPPRRAARGPRPHARDRVGRRPPHGHGRARRAGRARPARLPEDVGLEGHPRERPDRAGVGLPGGPPRRARHGARGRAARPRPGDDQVVEGGAPRRVRGLQPERARPHGRLGLLRAAHARGARLLLARVERGARRRVRGPAPRHGARPARHARRPERRHRRARGLARARCWTWPAATRRRAWATLPGRRTSPSRRTSRSASSRAATAIAPSSAAVPAIRSRAALPRVSTSSRGFGSKPRTGQGHEHEFED